MSTILFKLGQLASRHPWRVIGAWLVLACATFALNSQVGGEANDEFRLPGAESQRAVDLLEEKFPAQNPYTSQVVFSRRRARPQPETRALVGSALDEWPHCRTSSRSATRTTPGRPCSARTGCWASATVTFDTSDVELIPLDEAEDAVAAMRDAGLDVEYSGLLGAADAPAEPKSELIGMGVAVVVLVLAFGSLVAMSLPARGGADQPAGRHRHDRPDLGAGPDPQRRHAGRVDARTRASASTTHSSSWPGTGRTSAPTSDCTTPSAGPTPPPDSRSSSPEAPWSWRSPGSSWPASR